MFLAARVAVDPRRHLAAALPIAPECGRVVVVGAGKAAAPMALVAAHRYGPRASGVVVVPHGHGLSAKAQMGGVRVIEGGHPVPDEKSLLAANAIIDAVSGLSHRDLVVCLLSGGGSALMERPVAGLSLQALKTLTQTLLASGATVSDLNTVRKHLSEIKGGRLALTAWPARVETFALSDVPGDDAAAIASGPTVADPTTNEEALSVLERYGIAAPAPFSETPKLGDPRLARSHFHLVGNARVALDGAADCARRGGWRVLDLGDRIEGEAAVIARQHAALALQTRGPVAILSGGELTVTHSGEGRGGPNREYALALAIALNGAPGIYALAADTDGLDGAPDAAGALIGPFTLDRAAALGLDPREALVSHNSGPFFAALGDALVTGPTRTNVSDFRVIMVGRPASRQRRPRNSPKSELD